MTKKLGGTLSGLKVVDLSRVLAGSFCTQILRDQGAEVIKIQPSAGVETRCCSNGSPESGPIRVGMSIIDMGTGMKALAAILIAALESERSGLGQKLDISLTTRPAP